jgi:hypothetical protein
LRWLKNKIKEHERKLVLPEGRKMAKAIIKTLRKILDNY